MPTQTRFLCPSGGSNVDLSGIFEPLNGGTAYGSSTNYKVGTSDFNALFHASTSTDDRPSFNTGFKLSGGSDLSTIFRRYGYSGGVTSPSITSDLSSSYSVNKDTTTSQTFSITASGSPTLSYQWQRSTNGGSSWSNVGSNSSSYTETGITSSYNGYKYKCTVSSSAGGTTPATSTVATLTVYWLPTYATISGGSTQYNDGDDVTLTHIGNDGNASIISRQWYYWNGTGYTDISGATSSSITFNGAYNGTPDDMGGGVYRYYYTIRLQNAAGYTDQQNDSAFGVYFDIQT